MKNVKVRKSPEVLGLSRKSKDNFKTKKTPKPSLSASKKNVISRNLPESDIDVKVKLLHKKQSHKNDNSPKLINKISPKNHIKSSSSKTVGPSKMSKKKKLVNLSEGRLGTQNKSTSSRNAGKSPVLASKVNYIDGKQVTSAAQALLTDCKTKNKNALFKSEGTPILIQFEAIVAPKHPKTTLRLVLPHSTHSKVSEVVLIITDEKKHHRKLRHDDEMYITNFNEKLKEFGITQVSKVMTLRQIRAEYYTHEMRRKLCDMFDVFLCDGKVAKKLSSLIGKNFYLKRKTPIPVALEKEDKIKLNIERALRKTEIVLKSTSCSNSVCRIGNTDMKAEEIAENLEAFSKAMDTCNYPGGWRNVKAVYVKTPTSAAFPVYYSYLTPSEVGTAELKQTLPKHCVAVKGELSTIGRDVIVRPDGTIEVEGVSDLKSLMHELYKHSGFKDKETLDLTDAEYKEVVRELQRHTAKKAKAEEHKAASQTDMADMLTDNAPEDDSSDEDDNTIHGEVQGDEENDDEDFGDSDDEEKKEDGAEVSYMQEWEQAWLNQASDEELEDHAKQKGKKNIQGKRTQQQGQVNKKRKQSIDAEQGGKKRKADAQETKKPNEVKYTDNKNAVKERQKNKGNKSDTQSQKFKQNTKGDKRIQEGKQSKADKKIQNGIQNKKSDKQGQNINENKKSDKINQNNKQNKKADTLSDDDKQKKKADKKVKKNKKDTPLRKSGGVHIDSSENSVLKKKAKKSRSKAPNFIPL